MGGFERWQFVRGDRRTLARTFDPACSRRWRSGTAAVTREDPWAAEWLGRLLQAETECVERRPALTSAITLSPAARQAVERVWREVRAYPAAKTQLVRRVRASWTRPGSGRGGARSA